MATEVTIHQCLGMTASKFSINEAAGVFGVHLRTAAGTGYDSVLLCGLPESIVDAVVAVFAAADARAAAMKEEEIEAETEGGNATAKQLS